jgi:hypothetical protein
VEWGSMVSLRQELCVVRLSKISRPMSVGGQQRTMQCSKSSYRQVGRLLTLEDRIAVAGGETILLRNVRTVGDEIAGRLVTKQARSMR